MILASFEGQLCLCDWKYRKMRMAVDNRIKGGLGSEYFEESTDVIRKAIDQLEEYFAGERKEFGIQLLMVGTSFQNQIWNELINIPYGETESYLGLSHRISNKKAIRAVAAANGANALSIFVPCHRIIGSRGELVGYAGGTGAKKKLLQLEGAITKDTQLEIFE